MTPEELDAIEARAKAATEDPPMQAGTRTWVLAYRDVPALVAEVRMLREALKTYGDHTFVDEAGVRFDLNSGHASRYQDFLRCPDRWVDHCECGFSKALEGVRG